MIRHALNEIRESPGVAALAAVGAAAGLYETCIKPARPATKAWGALAVSVVMWDVFGAQTLTSGCHEAVSDHPLLTRAAISLLALHLASPKYDPFQLAYDIFK